MTVLMIVLALLQLADTAQALGPPVSHSCRIRWQRPTLNEDGSRLRDLASYEIFVSTTRGVYDWEQPLTVVSGNRTNIKCPDALLTSGGQRYLVMRSINLDGRASGPSNEYAFEIDLDMRTAEPVGGPPAAEMSTHGSGVTSTPPIQRTPWGTPEW